jgi:hypothetical protein
MAIRQIRLELRDVHGRYIADANARLKLARTDEPVGNSYRLDVGVVRSNSGWTPRPAGRCWSG